jgi:hypothetical protein
MRTIFGLIAILITTYIFWLIHFWLISLISKESSELESTSDNYEERELKQLDGIGQAEIA